MNCPHCGSKNTRKYGWRILVGKKVQKYQCRDCGKTSTSSKNREEVVLPTMANPGRKEQE